MKAIVNTVYGPPEVMRYIEVDKPTPKEDQVLIKIHAASVNALDWHMLKADPFFVRFMGDGVFRPKITIRGADIAGRVEETGANAAQFKPGDEVFGVVSSGGGGFAEYACTKENTIAPKPAAMSYEEAAAVPVAAVTALQGLRDRGKIKPGQSVLINGASGGVGTFAVQIAKAFDTEVTAVCSAGKMETARSLGADHVIDYTKEDFTKSGQRYDLILAANGYHSIFAYRRALKPNGIYVVAGGTMPQFFQTMLLGPLLSITGTRKFRGVMARLNQEDLLFLTGLIEAGKMKPVIERRYPLPEAAEAVRYVDAGHALGKVVITVI